MEPSSRACGGEEKGTRKLLFGVSGPDLHRAAQQRLPKGRPIMADHRPGLLALVAAIVLLATWPASAQTVKVGELNSYKAFASFLERYRKGLGIGRGRGQRRRRSARPQSSTRLVCVRGGAPLNANVLAARDGKRSLKLHRSKRHPS